MIKYIKMEWIVCYVYLDDKTYSIFVDFVLKTMNDNCVRRWLDYVDVTCAIILFDSANSKIVKYSTKLITNTSSI